jgi:quercetin dioxygenase-like cupin family protein
MYRVDFGSMPWDASAPGARAKVYEHGGRRLRLLELGAGFVEPGWCTKGHIGYVLEGRLEIRFGDGVTAFGPGDGLFIPAGDEHRHKARVLAGPVRLVLVEDAR